MILYEVKVHYQRQTGEDNPHNVKETYLVEAINCADAENRLMDDIKAFIFGESEVPSCKKVQYAEIFENPQGEYWYKARVEMITVEDDKEKRKAVSMLIQASELDEALNDLKKRTDSYDCEIISIAKSPIMDFLHATNAVKAE